MKGKEFDMTDSEHLVQRFVDQELSAEERVRFVARLGRDEGLRQRAIELEQLVLGVSRLPRPAVSDRFVASVMERIAPAPSIWRRLADTLWAPRDLQWNLASAVACLAVLVVGGVVAGRLALRPGRPAVTPGATDAPVAAAAATPSTVLVRLVILQPGARTVQVAGDFNGWNPARTSLEQISDGAWAVTIPLKPGRYEYSFVVDGQQWIADPFAAEQSDDGFGSRNAVLDVRPQVGAQS
jgi:Glycogen recognition site of AMP-activated protein kinase